MFIPKLYTLAGLLIAVGTLAGCQGDTEGAAACEVSYPDHRIELAVGKPITPIVPRVRGQVRSWHVRPRLPVGLRLDEQTGAIEGTPLEGAPKRSYTLLASGRQGLSMDTIELQVERIAPTP